MAQPQQGQPLPPVQKVYPLTDIEVQEGEDGERMLLVRVFAPNELLVFKIPKGEAEIIGKQLSAPSVTVATLNPSGIVIPGA